MGFIIAQSIKANDKVEFRVVVDYEEALSLMGRATNVHILSEDVPSKESRIVSRGKRGETKYLLVPKTLNRELSSNSNVKCQRLDSNGKIIVFYVIDR